MTDYINWIKDHPREVILGITITCAIIITVYSIGHTHGSSNMSLPNTETIELKAKVTELSNDLSTSSSLIEEMSNTISITSTALAQSNDKYIVLVNQFKSFAKATAEVNKSTYDHVCLSLKKFKILGAPEQTPDQYMEALKYIHDTLRVTSMELQPVVEKATEILSS